MNFQKICVMGLGYIGLPTASTFATHGIQVIGVDVNARVLETLKSGEVHIHEPGVADGFIEQFLVMARSKTAGDITQLAAG